MCLAACVSSLIVSVYLPLCPPVHLWIAPQVPPHVAKVRRQVDAAQHLGIWGGSLEHLGIWGGSLEHLEHLGMWGCSLEHVGLLQPCACSLAHRWMQPGTIW